MIYRTTVIHEMRNFTLWCSRLVVKHHVPIIRKLIRRINTKTAIIINSRTYCLHCDRDRHFYIKLLFQFSALSTLNLHRTSPPEISPYLLILYHGSQGKSIKFKRVEIYPYRPCSQNIWFGFLCPIHSGLFFSHITFIGSRQSLG